MILQLSMSMLILMTVSCMFNQENTTHSLSHSLSESATTTSISSTATMSNQENITNSQSRSLSKSATTASTASSSTNQRTQSQTQTKASQTETEKPKEHEIQKNLIAKQKKYFPQILDELQKNKKKTGHWIWWVFPTEMPGASEPEPKTSVQASSADYLLSNADIDAWSEILEEMYNLLNANAHAGRPDSAVIPNIDHGRINYALKFWLGTVEGITKRYPRFHKALVNLAQFKWGA
jgi:DNA mismatch repair ATPase MutL